MRTSAHFGTKKLWIFQNLWRIRTDRERRVDPVRTFCGQGGRRSIFRDFGRTSFKVGIYRTRRDRSLRRWSK